MISLEFTRIKSVIGEESFSKIANSYICVVGLGGVGSYVTEALARGGVKKLMIIDSDIVDITNINRQLIALHSTIGKNKVDVVEERLKDINPNIEIIKHKVFIDSTTISEIDFTSIDYIIDAIDFVKGKVELIKLAKDKNIPIISALGTGNKINHSGFIITDISKTKICPLAKSFRKSLRDIGINHTKVLYSEEEPKTVDKKLGSTSYCPPIAGLMIAGEVIQDLMKG